jgi:hypothetical protein
MMRHAEGTAWVSANKMCVVETAAATISLGPIELPMIGLVVLAACLLLFVCALSFCCCATYNCCCFAQSEDDVAVR